MKFKYKLLLGTIGLAILVISVQCAMQFMSSYRFVGFVSRHDSWQGIAESAQAKNWNCQTDLADAQKQLEEVRKIRDAANEDIMK